MFSLISIFFVLFLFVLVKSFRLVVENIIKNICMKFYRNQMHVEFKENLFKILNYASKEVS